MIKCIASYTNRQQIHLNLINAALSHNIFIFCQKTNKSRSYWLWYKCMWSKPITCWNSNAAFAYAIQATRELRENVKQYQIENDTQNPKICINRHTDIFLTPISCFSKLLHSFIIYYLCIVIIKSACSQQMQ